MATTLATLLSRCKRRYGLDSSADDDLLSNALFIDRVNEVLQEAAEFGAFREEFTLNLSGTVAKHTLSTRLLSIVEGTVRVDYDGSGDFTCEPERMDESELRAYYGPLENLEAGVPAYYYLQRELTADATLSLYLAPRSDTARTNGLKFWAEVVPTVLTATSDSLPVQISEERYLIPGLLVAASRCEFFRGRPDGPRIVAQAEADWQQALADWADALGDTLDGGTRRIKHTEPELMGGYY
jgi:hypothetical protein